MTRINFSKEGNTPFQKLLGHNKDIMLKWSDLENLLFSTNTFTSELKEQVRRTLAFNNGCEYCMAKGKPFNNINDSKILAATKFANSFSKNSVVSDEDFIPLNNELSEKEISELIALICFITASQKFGATLNLQPSCSINI